MVEYKRLKNKGLTGIGRNKIFSVSLPTLLKSIRRSVMDKEIRRYVLPKAALTVSHIESKYRMTETNRSTNPLIVSRLKIRQV